MSRHTAEEVLDFIADDEFVMEGSDDELEDYVYDDSSHRDENIDIDDQPATPLSPLLHNSPLSSQIVNSPPPSPPSSPPASLPIADNTAWTDSPIVITPFSEVAGPTFMVIDSPLEVFNHFFTDDLYENITAN